MPPLSTKNFAWLLMPHERNPKLIHPGKDEPHILA